MTLTLAAAAFLLADSTASADFTCTYDAPTKTVTGTVDGGTLTGRLTRLAGGEIAFGSGVCGAATVTNTDRIVLNDQGNAVDDIEINLFDGPFAPGATSEATGDPEIEIEVNSPAEAGDDLRIFGTTGDDTLRAGAAGINLNAAAETHFPDVDLTLTGIDTVEVSLSQGSNTFTANGATLSDTPSPLPFELFSNGPGTLTGGAGNDRIVTFDGNDTLRGGAGDDVIFPGNGDDTVDGEGGSGDTVNYSSASGVTVSLQATAPQPTGGAGLDTIAGMENLTGSNGADTLIGSAGPNRIIGGNGDDVITGGAGDDELFGQDAGNTLDGSPDTVRYAGNPGPVALDLGLTAPQNTGAAGTDTVRGFSNVIGSSFGDTLVADSSAGGANVVDGGRGDDVLRVKDGLFDQALCGDELDTVFSDDIDSLTGCETVNPAPDPGPGSDPPPTVADTSDPPPPAPGDAAPAPGAAAGDPPVIAAAPPSNAFTASVRPSRTGAASLRLVLPGPGVVSALAKAGRTTVGRVSASRPAAGPVTLKVKPSKAALKLLRKRGKLRVTVRVTFTPSGGTPATKALTVTLKLKKKR